jgi:hypothetical protein
MRGLSAIACKIVGTAILAAAVRFFSLLMSVA